MYLNRIEVRNFRLQGQDIIWDLQPDVNILVGYNGCGKTSLLKMIYELYSYNNETYIATDNDSSLVETIKQQGVQSITIFEGNENNYQIFRPFFGRLIPHTGNDFENNIQLINTFDTTLSHYKKIFSEMKTFPFEMSLLDLSLEKIKIDFLLFNHRIRKDLEKLHFEPETLTATERKEISDKIENAAIRRKKLIKIIDRLFIETQKVLDIVNADFSFLDAEKNEILLTELSSGEKQILYILLTVFLQNEEPAILLLDEPEISMHIYWLRELISIIREINPNCQLIIATHSPTIVSQGWFDKTKNWEEIISPYYSLPSMVGHAMESSVVKRSEYLEEIQEAKGNYTIQTYYDLNDLRYLTYLEIIDYNIGESDDIDISEYLFEPLSLEKIKTIIQKNLITSSERYQLVQNIYNLQEALETIEYLINNSYIDDFDIEILWRKTTNNSERKQVLDFANKHKLGTEHIKLNRFKSLKPKNGKKS